MSRFKVYIVMPDDQHYYEGDGNTLVVAKCAKQAKRLAVKHNDVLRELHYDRGAIGKIVTQEIKHLRREADSAWKKAHILKDIRLLRLAGWGLDGDVDCASCCLYEMDGRYPVCKGCDYCEECGCECYG